MVMAKNEKKKNPFIFTIKFDEKDSEHVRITSILNSANRKNQLIVNAILCYIDSGYINIRPWNIKTAIGFSSSEYIDELNSEKEELLEDDIEDIIQSLKDLRL